MITVIDYIDDYPVVLLTKEAAVIYGNQITDAWNLVPNVQASFADVIHEHKKHQKKWSHSLVVVSKDLTTVIAIAIAYERPAENNLYSQNSIHLATLSVLPSQQKKGIGTKLLNLWLAYNKELGFLKLSGVLKFSLQTDATLANSYARKIYSKQGFMEIGSFQHNGIKKLVYFYS